MTIALIALWSLPVSAAPEMVAVPSGTLLMGANDGPAEEQPQHKRMVKPFLLDKSPVSVAAFGKWVAESTYRTEAEKFGDGAVMHMGTGYWYLQKGATWQKPFGPKGDTATPDHPVTQVSFNDAKAYCAAHGKRLPTEAEWEHAARGGNNAEIAYAFGPNLLHEGEYLANVWTGIFPVMNTGNDGFHTTSPIGHYGVTPIGLTDMAGNVWEWVDTWFTPYPDTGETGGTEKVQRGGSYLCDPKVCHGFRVTARGHATPDSSHIHVGFRCAKDIEQTL
ncbi:MAG: formylglycine-generating enzyme family protein [Alphaproteobacteria bacterium]